jgi:hypothetical protein
MSRDRLWTCPGRSILVPDDRSTWGRPQPGGIARSCRAAFAACPRCHGRRRLTSPAVEGEQTALAFTGSTSPGVPLACHSERSLSVSSRHHGLHHGGSACILHNIAAPCEKFATDLEARFLNHTRHYPNHHTSWSSEHGAVLPVPPLFSRLGCFGAKGVQFSSKVLCRCVI